MHNLKKDIQTKSPFKNTFSKESFYNWTTQWNNLHHHNDAIIIENIFKNTLLIQQLLVNSIYIKSSQNNLKIIINTFGIFNEHQARKIYKLHLNKLKHLTLNRSLNKYASIYIPIYNVKNIQILFYTNYIPKNKLVKDCLQIFRKNKNDRYFKMTIQLVYAIYKGIISTSLFNQFILICVRKNSRRTKFLSFLKRLIDWYFIALSKEVSIISGVRAEIKGRFTAKSRARKQILSVGRIRIKEQDSPVLYKKDVTITKFGSLSIKVWICPKTTQSNVIRT